MPKHAQILCQSEGHMWKSRCLHKGVTGTSARCQLLASLLTFFHCGNAVRVRTLDRAIASRPCSASKPSQQEGRHVLELEE